MTHTMYMQEHKNGKLEELGIFVIHNKFNQTQSGNKKSLQNIKNTPFVSISCLDGNSVSYLPATNYSVNKVQNKMKKILAL